MANKVKRLKRGMGGSHNGQGRSETTKTMKRHSKKRRRLQGRQAASEGLADA